MPRLHVGAICNAICNDWADRIPRPSQQTTALAALQELAGRNFILPGVMRGTTAGRSFGAWDA